MVMLSAHRARLIVVLGLGGALSLAASGQSTDNSKNQPAAAPVAPVAVARTGAHHYRPNLPPKRAAEYYALIWGVEALHVKAVESGELIRFTYRVLDAQKATPLNDKSSEPSLIDPQAGVRLEIPQLEKVGKLRQSSTPEAGKTYWMAFSNKGRMVKPGDHVNVVIGNFRAEGLVVE